jgi:hypothetical protein
MCAAPLGAMFYLPSLLRVFLTRTHAAFVPWHAVENRVSLAPGFLPSGAWDGSHWSVPRPQAPGRRLLLRSAVLCALPPVRGQACPSKGALLASYSPRCASILGLARALLCKPSYQEERCMVRLFLIELSGAAPDS